MAVQVPSPGFIAIRRRALAALALYPDGLTRDELLGRGFKSRVLGHLLIAGLATAHTEGRGKPTQVKITEAGRLAIRRRAGGG
jgi:hypothetical protein